MATLLCPSCGTETETRQKRQSVPCQQCGHQIPSNPAAYHELSERNASFDFVLRIYTRVMLLLLLYVLSTGPMYWSVYEAFNASGSTFLAKLYYPIALACDSSDTICDWFDWYVGLWVF